MRSHKRRNRDIESATRITSNHKPNPAEYKEAWNIYRLTSGAQASDEDPTSALTAGEYVSKIFGNLSEGTQLIRNYIVPATEFVDPITKESGKLRLKNNGIPIVGDPDVDSFFPKFLWKGFLQTYTPQIVENQRTVYFLCKEDPIVDAIGKITRTDMFMLYYSGDKRNQGNHKQTKIVLSYIDSNVAKDSNDKYITMEFYTKPSQPSNAKYLLYKPKTNAIIGPNSFIVETDPGTGELEEKVLKVERTKTGNNLLNWELVYPRFKVPTDASFELKEVMWSEYKYMLEMRLNLKPSDDWNSIPGVVEAGQGAQGFMPTPLNNSYPTNDANDYYTYGTGELATFGTSDILDSFRNHLTDDWRAGGSDSNLTQFPKNTVHSRQETAVWGVIRSVANWKNNSSYFLADIFDYTDKGLGVLGRYSSMSIFKTEEAFDKESKKKLFADLLEGNGQINGLAFNTQIPSTIEENIANNINNLDGESYAIVNSMGNIDSVLDPISWVYNNYTSAQATFGETRFRLPDAAQTFPNGGINMNRELFRDSNYSENKFDESAILFEIPGGDSNIIASFEVGIIGGTANFQWLDKNLEPAIGVNTDGEKVVLPSLQMPSPQRFGPLNGRAKIAYI